MSKVFGLGLSRTGTTSLTLALRTLGYNVRHDLNGGGDVDFLLDVFKGKFQWKQFDRSAGALDIPISIYYREFDAQYPGSKFILTIRDKESWLESCEHLIAHLTKHIRTDWPNRKDWHMVHMDGPSLVRLMTYGRAFFDREQFSRTYDKHYQEVTEYFKDKPNQFLIMNICNGEGWEKLCPFMGKPIPKASFPHVNKRKT